MKLFDKSKSATLPVFLLAGVFLLLGVLFRLGASLYVAFQEMRQPQEIRVERPENLIELSRAELEESDSITGNVFQDIHTKYPGYRTQAQKLLQQEVPYVAHNPVQGNEKSKVHVTIFHDNSCTSCRQHVAQIIRKLQRFKDDIRLVYKFMPVRDENGSGGIFDQVAWRSGFYDAYLDEVLRIQGEMDADAYIELLRRVGVDFDVQQKIMREQMLDIVDVNQQDAELASALDLYKIGRVPVVFVNGYRLGQAKLAETNLDLYVERLLKGEEVIPDS